MAQVGGGRCVSLGAVRWGGVSGGLGGASEGGHPGGSGRGKPLHSEGAGLLGTKSHTSIRCVSSLTPAPLSTPLTRPREAPLLLSALVGTGPHGLSSEAFFSADGEQLAGILGRPVLTQCILIAKPPAVPNLPGYRSKPPETSPPFQPHTPPRGTAVHRRS